VPGSAYEISVRGFVVGESRLLGCVWVGVSRRFGGIHRPGENPWWWGGGGGSGAVRGILTVPHSPSWVAAIRGQKLNAMHGV
jgi:hypothetical protein